MDWLGWFGLGLVWDWFPFLIKQSAWDENLVPKNTGCGMTGNRSPWENPVTWIKPGIISQPFSHHCPDKTSSVTVLDKGRDEVSVKKPEVTTRKSLVSKAMLYTVWFVMLSP